MQNYSIKTCTNTGNIDLYSYKYIDIKKSEVII